MSNIEWLKRHSTIINILAAIGQVILGSLIFIGAVGVPAWVVALIALACNVAILFGQRTKQLPKTAKK